MTFYCNITFKLFNHSNIPNGICADVEGLGIAVNKDRVQIAKDIIKESFDYLYEEFDLHPFQSFISKFTSNFNKRKKTKCELFISFQSEDISDLASFASYFESSKTTDFEVMQIVLSKQPLDSSGLCIFKAKKKKPSAK